MKTILSPRTVLRSALKQLVASANDALFGLIALGLVTSLPLALRAGPLDNWHMRNPTMPLGDYRAVSFANGTFVTYSLAGTIITSTDGTNWNANPVGWGGPSCLNIANGRFYIGIGYGNMISSSDGANWTVLNPANTIITDVTFGNGIYVASTILDFANKNLATSANPITGPWTTRNDGWTNNAVSVAYGSGVFVAVGDSGTISSSANGITWTTRISGTAANLKSVRYGNGNFIAGGDSGTVLTSSNGVNWSVCISGSAQSLSGLGFVNGLWIAVSRAGTILTSTNGINWSGQSSGTASDLNGIAFGNATFVVTGNGTTILTSTDGANWSQLTTSVTSQRLTSVAYGGSNYVAVGFGGTVLTSPSGVTWTRQNSGTSLGLYSVAQGNGTFVAVGQIILSSPDGINWTTSDSGVNYDFEAVAYLNGAFMTVGANGAMKVSTDGLTWTPRSSGTSATLYGLAYGNALYVVVGAGGIIETSPDGLNWTSRTSHTAQDLNGVTYSAGLFVAQGNAGIILTSTDGISWTSRNSGSSQGLATTAYGFGNFVTVGLNGVTLTSTNGADWVTRNVSTTTLLIGITAGPTNFVSVGDSGWILESDPFPPFGIARQPANQTVAVGDTAWFSVEPWGVLPIGFQWHKGLGQLSGATNSTLTLSNCQMTDATNYSVVVSNVSGVLTSSVATLTVLPALITPQPHSQTVRVGATVLFSAGIHGFGPFSYQWLKEGFAIASATNTGFSITNVQLSDAGAYSFAASNSYGSTTSSVARLTVSAFPPVTSILYLSDFTLGAYGQALTNLGLSYQSFSDDTSLATALNNANAPSTLAVIDAAASYVTYHDFSALVGFLGRGGRAALEYWNLSSGSVATAFQVNVGTFISWNPVPIYDWGGSAFFSGVSNPVNMQSQSWCGTTLQPSGNAYAVAGFLSSAAANESAVIIGNSNRSIITSFPVDNDVSAFDAIQFAQNEIQFLLQPPPAQPVITFQPQDQAVSAGQAARFTVAASGVGTSRYRWFYNQTHVITGATNVTYSFGSVQLTNAGSYSVVVSNAFGAVTSRLAALTVTIPQLTIMQSGSSLNVSWPYPSTGWILQQNADLSTSNWTPSGGVTNDGTINFTVITSPTGNLFYRLKQ